MNNTLQNGFKVLEYLAQSGNSCSVKEIAEHLQLPNSHACRLLKTLQATGYVEQIAGSRQYQISLQILCLSNARLKNLRLRQVGQMILRQLCQKLQLECVLSAWSQTKSIIIATEYPDNNLLYDSNLVIGNTHQTVISACGKVCAAFASPTDLEQALAQVNWLDGSQLACHDEKSFRQELDIIRQNGFARMLNENTPDVASAAAPIRDANGNLAGAVGVVLPRGEQNWTPLMWDNCSRGVMEAAAAISQVLGFIPSI